MTSINRKRSEGATGGAAKSALRRRLVAATLFTVLLTAGAQAAVTGSRDLPNWYWDGTTVTVTLNVAVTPTAPYGVIVEEILPEGWTPGVGSLAWDQYDPAENRLRWLLPDNGGVASQALAYDVWIPHGETAAGDFSGNLYYLASGIETTVAIGGETQLAKNQPPSITGAVITPATAYYNSTLSVTPVGWSDPDGDPAGYRYQWRRNGSNIPGATGTTLTSDRFGELDNITCAVTAWDGRQTGNTAWPVRTITNQAPVFGGLASAVASGHAITLAWAAATDASPPITYDVYVATSSGGQNFGTPDYSTKDTSLVIEPLHAGQTFFFVVRARDRHGLQATNLTERSATVPAVPPATLSGARTLANAYFPGTTITVQVALTIDPAATIHGVILEETLPAGWRLGNATPVEDRLDPATNQARWLLTNATALNDTVITYQVYVPLGETATADFAGELYAIPSGTESLVAIGGDTQLPKNQPPSVGGASITPDPAQHDSTLSVTATGWSDADGDPAGYRYQWKRNGSNIGGATGATLAGNYFGETDSISCTVTAWDGYQTGNTVTASAVNVINQPPVFAGLATVTESDHAADLAWATASDGSPPVKYNIYMAETLGGQNFGQPTFTTYDTTLTVDPLIASHPYYFVVRAEDRFGLEETNAVEREFIPTDPALVTALRDLPPDYDPGAPMTVYVNFEYDAASNMHGLILEETVPEGWELVSANPPSDSFDPATNKARWLLTNATRLTDGFIEYTLNVPIDASGVYTFSGEVSIRGAGLEYLLPVIWETDISETSVNQRPRFTHAAITPDPARKEDTLGLVVGGWSDWEGAPEAYLYQWKLNGAEIVGQTTGTLANIWFEEGDTVTCEVTAWDGQDRGNTIETAAVTIQDIAPDFAGLETAGPGDGKVTLSWAAAYDASPPIWYNIYQALSPGGQDFGAPTFRTTNASFEVSPLINNRVYYFVVRAEDRHGNEDDNVIERAAVPQSTILSPVYEGRLNQLRLPGLYGGGSSYAHPALADLDLDGDVDVLVGESDGSLTYWQNVGTAETPAWSSPAHDYAGINVGGHAAPCLGDVTGDGRTDLLVGQLGGTLTFFENVGTGGEAGWAPGVANYAGVDVILDSVPVLGDLDRDGDLDLLVGGFDGTLDLVKNLGGGAWGPQLENYADLFVGGNCAPALWDVDGDDDLDLLAGGYDGTLTLVENTGTPVTPEWDAAPQYDWFGVSLGQWSAPAIGDINGDNQRELFVGNRRGEVYSYTLVGGAPQSQAGSFEFIDIGGDSVPALGDLDGDGDDDLLLGSADGQLVYYQNVGNALQAQWAAARLHYMQIDVGSYSAPALRDLSGDGRLDLIVGEQNGNLNLFINTSESGAAAFNSAPDDSNLAGLDVGYYSRPCLLDVDGDGDGDLLVGNLGGTLTFCRNDSVGQPLQWAAPQVDYAGLDVGSLSKPCAGDIDGDGTLDLIVGGDDGALTALYNRGTPGNPVWDTPRALFGGIDVGAGAAPELADLDGDGDPDLLAGEEQGGLNLWKNMMYHLKLEPRSATLMQGDTRIFQVLDMPTTSSLEWAIVSNSSNCTLQPLGGASALYTAGTTGGIDVQDIIEARDVSTSSVFYSRSYINVIRPEDVGAAGKAIVCAGRKSIDDTLWPATDYITQLAYKTLRAKGFTRDDIFFLSPEMGVDVDGDGDPNNDIDAVSTLANLEYALTTWTLSSNTSDLTVYFADHGWREDGAGRFRINAGAENVLTAERLDAMLDTLQSFPGMNQNVILDCCNAGAFMSMLTPPANRQRLVATSSRDDQVSFFVAQGLISYSESFWNSIFTGRTFGQAFEVAQQAMARYQRAWIDGNGNGIYEPGVDDGPDSLAWSHHLGFAWIAGADRPQIGRVVSNQTLQTGETSALIWSAQIAGTYAIDRVWAVIVPPDFQPDTDGSNPVLNLPQLEMSFNIAEDRWEASTDTFTQFGSYKIILYAQDIWESVSFPKQVYVHKTDMNEKAVILVGSTPYDASTPLSASHNLGQHVYRTLQNRGFGDDRIRYLSDEIGNANVDTSSTLSDLQDALGAWAQDADQVTLFAVGEGSTDTLRLNAAESLSASALDALLDGLQTASGADVVVVLDCRASGTFIDDITTPTGGAERVVVTSCRPGRPSYCLGSGIVSFSHFFFSKIFQGASVDEAYQAARHATQFWTRYQQLPGLDDNRDGQSTSADGDVAEHTFIGAPFLTGGDDLPIIGAYTPDSEFNINGRLTLWASGVFDSDGIASVKVVVVPQEPLEPQDGVELELAYNFTTRRWEARHTFTVEGSYAICFVATDGEQNDSPSYQSQITVGHLPCAPDEYEDDDQPARASRYLLSSVAEYPVSQLHNFHDAGDADWVKFDAIASSNYTLWISNPGPNCNATIELYRAGDFGAPLLDPQDAGDLGDPEELTLECLATDTYYWKVCNQDPQSYGLGTTYTLLISDDSGANNGLASSLGGNVIRCSWEDGLQIGDKGYFLYHRTLTAGGWVKVNDIPTNGLVLDDNWLNPDTVYFYYVSVVQADDTEIQWTPVFSGKTDPDTQPPFVDAIRRLSVSPTNAYLLDYLVNFSEHVSGVDVTDFEIGATGVVGAEIREMTGSGATRVVTVGYEKGDGTLQLRLIDDDTIVDLMHRPLGGVGPGNGDYTNGEVYLIVHSAPFLGARRHWPLYE